jgi:DnaA family protein
MHPQIPLPLKLRDDFSFSNFIEDENGLICQSLKNTSESFIFLAGGNASGKTHLLQAACQYATQQNLTASYLPLAELYPCSSELLSGMQHIGLICIDDIEKACGDSKWEAALFDLFNQLKQQGGRLIISASTAANYLPIQLNDLKSRLTSGLPLNINPLNDGAIKQALTLRAQQFGLELNREVCQYLLTRYPRNLAFLLALLEELDQATLAAQKKLTVPFLKQHLSKQG